MANIAPSKTLGGLRAPFARCLSLQQATYRTYQLASYGVRHMTNHLPKNQTLTPPPPWMYSIFVGFELDTQLGSYTEGRITAEVERLISEDFPTLRAQTAIGLWYSIELLLREFAAFWSETDLDEVDHTLWSAGGSGSTHATDPKVAVKKIMQKEHWKSEVRRREALHDAFGLATPQMPDHLLVDLTELEAVRHIIVHNGSIVDQKFKDKVSANISITENVGDIFRIDDDRISRYRRSSIEYVGVLMAKVRQAIPSVVNG